MTHDFIVDSFIVLGIAVVFLGAAVALMGVRLTRLEKQARSERKTGPT